MKRYHPIGVAVNSKGVRTYYLLSDLEGTQLKRNNPSPRATTVVDHAEFTNMVVDEEVQCFQGSPTGPIIKYTDEEVKSLTGKKGSTAMYTGDDYWKNEVVFCDQFIKEPNSVNISPYVAYHEADECSFIHRRRLCSQCRCNSCESA